MIRTFFTCLALFGICGMGLSIHAQSAPKPPIEAYGKRATVRSISISPSGELIAFIGRTGSGDLLFTYSDAEGIAPKVNLSNLQGTSIWFPTENHIIIRGYETTTIPGYKGKVDYSAAFAYNLETGKFNQLLKGTKELYPAQSGLGRIIGRLEGTNEVLMPAWTGSNQNDNSQAVFKVDLNKTRGRKFKRGTQHTLSWLIDTDGTMLARAEMKNGANSYSIYSEISGNTRLLFEQKNVERPPFTVLGVKADRSALILRADNYDIASEFVEMDFDGNIKPAQLGQVGKDVERIFKDGNNVIHGVQYSGLLPSYDFFDPDLNASLQTALKRFEGDAVDIRDWSEDWSKVLLYIFNYRSTGKYVILNTKTGEVTGILRAREGIPPQAIGEVMAIEYEARDGLTIPAILTLPAGVEVDERLNLPTIIMPHGGPRSHDAVGFDWLAQYFANRGYIVLQPNFRGSSGFGADFMLAGNGEWGGKMQDDVSDGLQALIDGGYTDPDRVCIIGWSYGGYAALAGGAFTPELYKCVVAVAPVSNLVRMLQDERRDHGREHYIVDYWKEMIGDPKSDKDKLIATSPINFAENFTAPVLLIHAKDDSVVKLHHSTKMEKALRRAGKDVTLLKIKGDGHSLLDSDNRLEALIAMADFVDRHIGEN